jgi:hypothetical protein
VQKCSLEGCLVSVGIARYKETDRFYCRRHYHDTMVMEALAKGHHVFCVSHFLGHLSEQHLLEHYIYLESGMCPNCQGWGQLGIKA